MAVRAFLGDRLAGADIRLGQQAGDRLDHRRRWRGCASGGLGAGGLAALTLGIDKLMGDETGDHGHQAG